MKDAPVTWHHDPASFRDAAWDFLLRDEAANNLILGILDTLQREPSRYPNPRMATMAEGGSVVGAALMTPPHNIIVSADDSRFPEALARDAMCEGLVVPGVTAPAPIADIFCAADSRLTGRSRRLVHRMCVRSLREVRDLPDPPGVFGKPTDADLAVLAGFIAGFDRDIGDNTDFGPVAERAQGMVRGGRGRVWRDTDGRVVCMAMSTIGGTPHGRRISQVYTPPAERAKGYCTATVRHLCNELIAAGERICYLFAEIGNPASNRAYDKIGFDRGCEFRQYAFEPGPV